MIRWHNEYPHLFNKYGQSAKTEQVGDAGDYQWLAYFDRADYCAQADSEAVALERLMEMEKA